MILIYSHSIFFDFISKYRSDNYRFENYMIECTLHLVSKILLKKNMKYLIYFDQNPNSFSKSLLLSQKL